MEKETVLQRTPEEIVQQIVELVHATRKNALLQETLMEYHERDIALALCELGDADRSRLYATLSDEELGNVFAFVENLGDYLSELSLERRVAVLSRLEPTDAVEYLRELDRHERHEYFRRMPKEAKEDIFLRASFDEEEIGSQMSDNYISAKQSAGVRGLMSALVKQAENHDNVSTIYVLDDEEHFVGAIDLKDLIVARAKTPLEDIMKTNFPTVFAEELISECIPRLSSYSEDSIPVLDEDGVLVGVLTADILADLTREDIEEDYARLAGLGGEERVEEGIGRSVKQRLPWLAILFFLGFLVSGVVGIFEGIMGELTLLVSFQSLILGMAGNVGTQSLAVTIRMLSEEGAGRGAKLRQVIKEMGIGLFNGSLMASLSFVLVLGYLTLLRQTPFATALLVALSIAMALILSMLLSGMFGAFIPMLFQKIGIDPAVASGPFITTVSDLVAVVTYYGLAGLLMQFFI